MTSGVHQKPSILGASAGQTQIPDLLLPILHLQHLIKSLLQLEIDVGALYYPPQHLEIFKLVLLLQLKSQPLS